MNLFTQSTALMGVVKTLQPNKPGFTVQTRSGNDFMVTAGAETTFSVLQNIDGLNQDRFPNPANYTGDTAGNILKYIRVGHLVGLNCIIQINGSTTQFDARNVFLLQDQNGGFVFERPNWWLRQISSFADTWLKDLFGPAQTFDFSKYETNLGITGVPLASDTAQEVATLSRLIYGLSSAYLMTGCKRYLNAAQDGVQYQRDNFRFFTHDGKNIMWASAKDNEKLIIASDNGDDKGTIPLYEQIYALAGLAQYYRITQSKATLDDIYLTVKMFNDYFYDHKYNGYFSHLDPVSFTSDTDYLGINKQKKNWNSIGDHIPAYLINIIIALEPLPVAEDQGKYTLMLDTLTKMLFECTELVVTRFADSNPDIPYVNERFYQDWQPDHEYSWQQNRAVCGHNLKIAWNLTRVANYYNKIGKDSKPLMAMIKRLADHLAVLGIDQIRGGLFDTVEREPKNNMWIDFSWLNTKDFWQQEQAVLAYLITYGYFKDDNYLSLAREMEAFWNLYYLDHDNTGFFFRVGESGQPVLNASYAQKGSHSISGYHAFELNYLAHIYSSMFVSKVPVSLHFRPEKNGITSINVMPDFLAPKSVIISGIWINGLEQNIPDPFAYQLVLNEHEISDDIVVELTPVVSTDQNNTDDTIQHYTNQLIGNNLTEEIKVYPGTAGVNKAGKIAVLIENHYDFTELDQFSSFFPDNGYQVDFITYLWNYPSLTFYSNPTDDGVVQSKITVSKDVGSIDPAEYKAVILIGAYAMDRLRYQAQVYPDKENQSPAVIFLKKVIATNQVKIGGMCHSLWLYCADKSLLQGKKVTCAHNVICDVENAGGIVQYSETGETAETCVDGNLITGRHPGVSEAFMKVLLSQIQTT